MSSTAARELLIASGPEDLLRAVPTGRNSSADLTAGSDWIIALDGSIPLSSLRHTDLKEMDRFSTMVSSEGAAGFTLRQAAADRLLCSKAQFSHKVCLDSRYQHQGKGCTPAELEYRKCAIKVARAVDTLCRPSFTAFTSCLESTGAKFDVSKCLRERTAFDMCIEDF